MSSYSLFASRCSVGGGAGGQQQSAAAAAAAADALQNICAFVSRLVPDALPPGVTSSGFRAAYVAELLDALGRSQLLEHVAAAALRLAAAAACPPLATPDTALESAVTAAVEFAGTLLVALLRKAGLSSVEDLQSSLLKAPTTTAASSGGGGGGGSGAASAAAGPLGQEGVEQLRALVSGPAVQLLVTWPLHCAAGGAAGVEGALSTAAEPATQQAPTAGATAAALPALRLSPQQYHDAVIVFATVMQATAISACARPAAPPPSQQPAAPKSQPPGGVGAYEQQQPQRTRPQQLAPISAVHVFDVLARTLLRRTARPEPTHISNLDAAGFALARLLLVHLKSELSPRNAARRLPGFWRALFSHWAGPWVGGSDLSWIIFRALTDTRQCAPEMAAARSAEAAAAGAAGRCCYNLRCALDAGLLPALERAVRSAAQQPPRDIRGSSSSGSGNSSGGSGASGNAAGPQGFVCGLPLRLLLGGAISGSGAWPALLAHGSAAQAAGLIATSASLLLAVPEAPLQGPDSQGRDADSRTILDYLLAAMEQMVAVRCNGGEEGNKEPPTLSLEPQGEAATAGGGRGEGQQPPTPQPQPQEEQQQLHPAVPGAGEAARADTAGGGGGVTRSPRAQALDVALQLTNNYGVAIQEFGFVRLADLVAAGGAPPAGSAAAAQQALLASFALQRWLPGILGRLVREWVAVMHVESSGDDRSACTSSSSSSASSTSSSSSSTKRDMIRQQLGFAVQLLAAVVAADQQQVEEQAAAAGASAAVSPTDFDYNAAAAAAAAGNSPGAQLKPHARSLALACSPSVSVLVRWLAALSPAEHGSTISCTSSTSTSTAPSITSITTSTSTNTTTTTTTTTTSTTTTTGTEPELEAGILGLLEASLTGDSKHALCVLCDLSCRTLFDGSGVEVDRGPDADADAARGRQLQQHAAGVMRLSACAEWHGRHALADLLRAAAGVMTQAGAPCVSQVVESAEVKVAALALRRSLRGCAEWRRAASRLRWLLSPAEVEARLREVGVVVGGGVSCVWGSDGCISASSSSSSGGAPPAAGGPFTLCGNPACSSLDGPSALIAPGRGKTCARCRRITYCCGACQLSHWREGHSWDCAELAAAAGARATD